MSRSSAVSTTRRWRRLLLALLGAALVVGGCLSSSGGGGTQRSVRALDSFCGDAAACRTTGAAERTTGPTADSVGYRLGPGPATLDIPLDDTTTGLEVLARGRGALHVTLAGCSDCPDVAHEVGADYAWTDLTDVHVTEDGGWFGDAGPPSNPVVELSVRDDRSHVDIADVEQTYYSYCSVAPAGPR